MQINKRHIESVGDYVVTNESGGSGDINFKCEVDIELPKRNILLKVNRFFDSSTSKQNAERIVREDMTAKLKTTLVGEW